MIFLVFYIIHNYVFGEAVRITYMKIRQIILEIISQLIKKHKNNVYNNMFYTIYLEKKT